MNIVWKGSPNFDSNRKPIDRIVLHWFGAGTLESAHTTFQKPGGTSAHYGISGSRVWQWVKEENVAWHAGNYAMNQRSIGIEHDATTTSPASEETYKTSAQLLADICKKYNIPLDRTHVIKHSEVPRATQCPGTLDIDRIIALAQAINAQPVPSPIVTNPQAKLGLVAPYGVQELQAVNSMLIAKDARIKELEAIPPAPIFVKSIAKLYYNLAIEFEKV